VDGILPGGAPRAARPTSRVYPPVGSRHRARVATGRRALAPLGESESAVCPLKEKAAADPAPLSVDSVIVLRWRRAAETLGALVLALGPSGRMAFAGGFGSGGTISLCWWNRSRYMPCLVRDIKKGMTQGRVPGHAGSRAPQSDRTDSHAVHVMRLCGPADPELQKPRDIIDRQLRQLTAWSTICSDVSRITRGKICLHSSSGRFCGRRGCGSKRAGPLIESRAHELTVSIPFGADSSSTATGTAFPGDLQSAHNATVYRA